MPTKSKAKPSRRRASPPIARQARSARRPAPRMEAGWAGSGRRGKASPAKTGGRKRSSRGYAEPRVQARLELAGFAKELSKYWANADGLSADAAVSPQERQLIRNRCRYEFYHSSYAKGMALTLASDTVGTGPRLRMLTPDPKINRFIKTQFEDWCESIGLAEMLRTTVKARFHSGAGWAKFVNQAEREDGDGRIRLAATPVTLDLQLIEDDQVATPTLQPLRENQVDGITLDANGRPAIYHVLNHHPGDTIHAWPLSYRADLIPARQMLHYFRPDRANQHRGLPDIQPAAPLFALLRRFTLATILAGETAAGWAAVASSEANANTDPDLPPGNPFEVIPLERNMLTFLPEGMKLGQVTPEHPATTYEMFVAAILNEIARCLQMPYNIAAGNSSKYSWATGNLDRRTYIRNIDLDRKSLNRWMDRILEEWLNEAVLIEGYLPQPARTRDFRFPHRWGWPGDIHVDDAKDAKAQDTRIKAGVSNLDMECSLNGDDWEEVLEQRAKEKAKSKELGAQYDVDMSEDDKVPAPANSDPGDDEDGSAE